MTVDTAQRRTLATPFAGTPTAPATLDLNVYQGDDKFLFLTFLDGDGLPEDLTGWAFRAQVRSAVADSQPTVAADFGITVDENVVTCHLTGEQTTGFDPPAMVYDVEGTDPAGRVTTWVKGRIIVDQEVTR